MEKIAIATIATLFLLSPVGVLFSATGDAESLFRDEFVDLENWRVWEFDKVDRATLYEVRVQGKETVLRMESDRSASGLLLERNFSADDGVRLRWRWRADVLPDVSDPLRRQGDDYAIRVYVIFEKDASDAGWLERWVLRNAPFREEGILPERSLAYVWTDSPDLPDFFPNPFTDRVFMLPIAGAGDALGEWHEVEVSPADDYRRIFNENPPRHFRLALMSDADNSESQALAWLDFIEVTIHSNRE